MKYIHVYFSHSYRLLFRRFCPLGYFCGHGFIFFNYHTWTYNTPFRKWTKRPYWGSVNATHSGRSPDQI